MTNQEFKEKLTDMLIDGVKLSISNTETKLSLYAGANNSTDFMKQKATLDKMVSLATANGYRVSLDDIDISKNEGRTFFMQAVILREEKKEPETIIKK